jgi:type II secretory pathway component PulJ
MKTVTFKQRAFTIVEALVACAILSMISGAILAGALALQRSYLASSEFGAAKIEQLRVIDALKRDVRQASSVEVLGAGSTVVFTIKTNQQGLLSLGLPLTVLQALGGSTAPATKSVSYTVFDNRVLRTEANHTDTLAGRISRFHAAPMQGGLLATVAFKSSYAGRAEETEATRLITAVRLRGLNH